MSTQFKPILFSTPMVQAILEGRKTQTRRVVKHFLSNELINKENVKASITHLGATVHFKTDDGTPRESFCGIKNPYGNIGDVLWVREKYISMIDCETNEFAGYWYYAEMPEKFHKEYKRKWKPSIHMPKAACRLFLRIKDVRVERLQDITRDDCKKEGIAYLETVQEMWSHVGGSWYDYERKTFASLPSGKISPSMSFMSLWRSINGAESWNANPWVWVIEFERVEKPTNF